MFIKCDLSVHCVLSRRRRSMAQRNAKEGFSVHFALRTPDEYTIGVSLESLLLEPLFGQFLMERRKSAASLPNHQPDSPLVANA